MKNTGTLKVTTPTEREVVMTRVFDAPRRLVFAALTKPELFKRWFGPRGWSPAVCEIDLKVGGMEHGAAECYDKLAELLASPKTRGMERGAEA